MREVVNAGAEAGPEAPTTPMRAWWQKKASSSHETGGTGAGIAAPAHAPAVATTPEPRHAIRRVPRFVRYLWLALTMISLPLGIMLLVFPNVERVNPEEFALFVSFGVGQLFLAVASFLKSFQTRFHGWWRYLVKPLILFLCVQSVLVSAIMLGNANLRGDEAMLATFFIVFPAVVFLVLVFAALFRVDDEPAAAVVHTSTFTTPAGIGAPAAAAGEVQGAAMHGSAEAMTAAMPVRATTAVSVGSLSQYVPSPTTLVHSTVAFLGWMMLLAGTLLGLATAIDMPGLVMLDARGEDYGGPTAGMVRIFMGLATFVTMLIACGLLMGSRRPHGVAHVLRALFAVVISGGCIFFVYGTFAANGGLRASEQRAAGVPWSQIGRPSVLQNPVFPRPNREAVIEQYIEDMRTPFLVPAGLCAVAAATLLTWPARRQGLTVETGRTSNA